MQFPKLFEMLTQKMSGLNASVLRRGIGLLAITAPAALLNLGLSYLASKWLGTEDFGIYYTAITAINVAFAPATIMNLFFTRAITAASADQEPAHAIEAAEKVFRLIVSWGALAALALMALAVLLWSAGAGFAVLVACAVIFVIYISYCAEVGRISLQGRNKFFALGLFTLGWMTSRFIGGALGIYILGNVWGGLLGIGIATLLPILGIFRPWKMIGRRFFRPWARSDKGDHSLLELIKFSSFLKLSAGFILFMVVAHADILVAYKVLTPDELSVYSASAVLPKGMLVLTLPLIQLLFPLIVGERASARPARLLIVRGALLTLIASAAGVLIIDLMSGPLCTSAYGIAFCDAGLMRSGLLAIVAMCLLRLAISVDYASHLDYVPLALAIALTAAMFALGAGAEWTPETLAQGYFYFSLATLLGYAILSLAARVWWRAELRKRAAANSVPG